ncbi:uncharacterized protein MICPUCDRAFT_51212 [Micromonas pusilla CCMP1545]|uniref:Predicted protein n=1 Tax=Micromonas pusilla (strain CCMP1545) TaxID=564608 RepID=C1N103_MICPC|nr:uncharacterized protein MICPUCDRAFT_51212 [Micromonas pusilla CCMP1545]EEH54117.1 predicted protein [Micromonas pusilla CCMP1545]|eukprot:XP_003061487.1 predicted protein [Micromonas pusilla CCMP1545]
MATSLAAAAASVAPRATARPARPRAAARGVRGGSRSVVVRGKKGAWAKEFDPDYEKDKEVVEITAEAEGWPGLAKDTEVETYNILTKLTGPLNITWNGIGVIQVPKGATRRRAKPFRLRVDLHHLLICLVVRVELYRPRARLATDHDGAGAAASVAPRATARPARPRAAARGVRGGSRSVVVRGKKGAWAKEFDPDYEKDKEVVEITAEAEGWPGLAKDTEVETYNILTKLTGPLNITWNGIGVIQVPKGADKKESGNVCKTVLVQRKEQVLAECDRLYPKMKGKPKDYVIQLFEDPYADPVDLSAVPPAGLEPVPAEIKYMPKGKRYPY